MDRTHAPGSRPLDAPGGRRDQAPTPQSAQPDIQPAPRFALGAEAEAPADPDPWANVDGRVRRDQVLALQRACGNALTVRRIQALAAPAIQRHPPGATLLGGAATAGDAAASPPSAESPTSQDRTGGAAPAELGLPTLRTAYAQEALQRTFGGVAGRPIITGRIHIVANQAELYAQYDRIQISNGVRNRDTGRPWQMGDKANWNAARGLRTNAFAHEGEIWIDATQTDPTATVHEMLHVNTTSDFLSVVGRAINEGITQRLAVQAIRATGNSVAGSERTYQREQEIASALIGVVGEAVVQHAYFNGSAQLVATYEALMGDGSFAALKRTLDDTDAGYTAALAILRPPSVTQKIAAINALLDWWVSDDDLTIVERIVRNCSPAEKSTIAAAIQPRIQSLTSIGQRTRLRVILGVV